MKKTMKRMLAAVLAAACLPLTGVTASADSLDRWWGTATHEAFDGLVPVNTYGWNSYDEYFRTKPMTFLKYPVSGSPWVISASPMENRIQFTLRSAEDAEAMVGVMEQFFPDIRESYHPEGWWYDSEGRTDGRWYFRGDNNNTWVLEHYNGSEYGIPDPAFKAELESGLLHDLAKAHLITSFYGWGATAFYSTGDYWDDVLTGYLDTNSFYTGRENGEAVFTEYTIDWDAVQAYLDEHHPGCQVEHYEYHYQAPDNDPVQGKYPEGTPVTRINTPDTMTYKDKFELACELYEPFHMPVDVLFLVEASSDPLLGHNSLENKGDVTLDLELDIMDVIAANKYLLGASTLCDTARKNTDISGDGTPDAADSLAILKEIVGLTENFQET